MKLLILDANYPSKDNLYGDVFTHVRVKEYAKEFDVVAMAFFRKSPDYVYEGIRVRTAANVKAVNEIIAAEKPDVVLLHIFEGWMLDEIIKKSPLPFVVWVHGHEAEGWYRRLFNFDRREWKDFLMTVLLNTKQMYHFHRLVRFSNYNQKVTLVFVSKWLKKVVEVDALSRVRRYKIIPNPIDGSTFRYQEKDVEMRKHVLLIRSFDNRVYANDIAIEAILHLSKDEIFKDLKFTLYGMGRFFAELTDKVKGFSNVSIVNTFLTHAEIVDAHEKHGVFLIPSRQDTQGVSRCEAMASGLVPITSLTSGIPEFVIEGKTGFMTRSAVDVAAKIKFLYDHPDRFLEMSRHAATSIREITGSELVIKRELELIKNAVHENRSA